MSKMSQLHAELTEQAYELGFASLEEALAKGYEVMIDGNFARLVKTKDEQEEAHEAWLERRNQIIKNLTTIKNKLDADGYDIRADWVEEAINFINEGEI